MIERAVCCCCFEARGCLGGRRRFGPRNFNFYNELFLEQLKEKRDEFF